MADSKDRVAEFYDLRGDSALSANRDIYGSTSVPAPLREPYKFVEKKLAEIRVDGKSQKLLDLCCGTGIHSVYPAKLGFIVRGIDMSPKSIEAAQKLASINNVESLTKFEVGDGNLVGNANGELDVIIMSGSLYYFDFEKLAVKLNQALRPGGHFICIETNGSNGIMNQVRRLRSDRDSRTMTSLLRTNDVRKLSTYFKRSEVRYFDFFTLFERVLPMTVGQILHPIAARLDDFILNKLGLKFLAFKFVFIGEK